MSDEDSEKLTERRRNDVNIWEKRISLYLITAMVGACVMYLSNMDKSMALIKSEIAYNLKEDEERQKEIVGLQEVQEKLRLTSIRQESRICNLEDKAGIERPRQNVWIDSIP